MFPVTCANLRLQVAATQKQLEAEKGASEAARSDVTQLKSRVNDLISQVRSVESQRGQRQGVSKALERVGGVR